jgi:starch synthase (maltosyl-transferring)
VNKTTQTVESAGGTFHIGDVYPLIDGGRFPVKRIVGERVEIWADIYRDGHNVIAAAVIWRHARDHEWRREPMTHHSDDRWCGSFVPDQLGHHVYAIEAWTDEFTTWRRRFERKQTAGADVTLDAIEGASMLTKAQGGGHEATAVILKQCWEYLQTGDTAPLLTAELQDAMAEGQFRPDLTRSQSFPLVADRPRARSSAWYEMMPRGQTNVSGRHGTFKDCIARLNDVSAMGFDVICLTPIHPIGKTGRRGRNNAADAAEGDPGSPYAIGGTEGGHDTVHPELGTLDDFREFVEACRSRDVEVGLDLALQFSFDHPWVKEHPRWFRHRPDGSLSRAQDQVRDDGDIVCPDFSSEDAGALWNALREMVLFWIDQGVKIFRVDHPGSRPLPFWQWLIREIQLRHPDVVFLAAAFTRPKLMKGLAKLGFTQSCTHFTWRTQKCELEQHLNE